MIRSIRSFLGLIRFSHTVFALPFALTTPRSPGGGRSRFPPGRPASASSCAWSSPAAPRWRSTASPTATSTPRTPGPPAGTSPPGTARAGRVWLFLSSGGGFVASTLIFLREPKNPWPLIPVGAGAAVRLRVLLTKRFTGLAHFWLAASLFLAPVAAWIAIRGSPGWPRSPLLLGGAVLFWVAGFDILYACQDVEFDRKARLHSVPAALGREEQPPSGTGVSRGHARRCSSRSTVASRTWGGCSSPASARSPCCSATNTGSSGPTT